ncbi:sigma 54-interacting transcriptional regulator [Alicyclobacillus sp.]|uniref:sigma-54 interaction domain-containing protein n=1 Tax=Alicyclobacillus sp. TaxID=61169 RepID=UPI0025C0D5AA|nr:sigma 54-interacting transcriptional regulator [Alicyclobacillus sp.]MCL6516726.1 sigma 54-interacting transcriptional regulator [Alicyclobacillus sp.]
MAIHAIGADGEYPLFPNPPRYMESQFEILGFLDTPMMWIGEDGFITWFNRAALDLYPLLPQGMLWEDLAPTFSQWYIYRVHTIAGYEGRGMLVECVSQSDPVLRQQVEDLQRTNEELESILDAIDELYITDGDGITLRVNREMEKLYGLDRDAFIGRSVFDLERDRVFYPSATAIVLRTKKPTTVLQRTKAGRLLIVNAVPVFDKDGEIVRVISSATNITHMKWAGVSETTVPTTVPSGSDAGSTHVTAGTVGDAPWIAVSPSMRRTLDLVKRVACTDATVLLLGETGVGKNRIAWLIHNQSTRHKGPFVEVNCASIPEALLDSELFGYERGAFTGARKEGKLGKVETADGGTLFLNEIGELPLHLQGKLLDLLQYKTVTRVGSLHPRPLNIRVVAATNRNLREMVEQGRFRRDLYYRLTVFPIEVPPLRERIEDIPLLASAFLQRCAERWHMHVKTLHSETIQLLQSYNWPGNVREMENLMERLVLLTDDICILPEHLPDNLLEVKRCRLPSSTTGYQALVPASSPRDEAQVQLSVQGHGEGQDSSAIVSISLEDTNGLRDIMQRVEREIFAVAIRKWHTSYAIAEHLQISQPTVVRKLKQYGLKHVCNRR